MKTFLLILALMTSLQSFAAGIPLSTNFTVNTALPIDDRMSVANNTARDAIPSLRRWEGMLVYSVGSAQHYVLVGGIANANWTSISGSSGGGISNWVTAKVYAVNDVVIQSLKIYQCLIAHTSGTFATDLGSGDWQEISASSPGNLTGAVTSVGLATSLGSFTSANLSTALTDETGTGSNVFATSPTLVTPVLGTPTSVTLTNGTGLPVATGISGLGTGVATFLATPTSANLITAVTDETGTGALVFATSPTLVTPNIGVATATNLTTPVILGGTGAASTLTLRSTSGTGTSDALIFQVGTNGATEAMRVMTNGRIGVGTATPNANAILDLTSTTKAFMAPRMTTAQMLAVPTPTQGMEVYNTDFQTISTYNGTNWVYGLGVLNGDASSTAVISSTGVISRTNKTWLSGNCVVSGTSQYDCPIVAGYATLPLNCLGNGSQTSASNVLVVYDTANSTNTNARFYLSNSTTGAVQAATFGINCQKQGVDYAASTASAFATTNATVAALYTGAPATGTLAAAYNTTTFGTKVQDTHSAYSAGTYTVPVAGKYSMAWAVSVNGTYNSAQQLQCSIFINGTQKYQGTNAPTASIGRAWVSASVEAAPLNQGDLVTVRCYDDGTALSYESNASANYFSIVKVDSNLIIGSFAGYGKAPGLDISATPNLDTFTVSFGTTNAITACSASPCFINQIGTAVSSLTRVGVGSYSINLARTYSNFKCGGSVGNGPSYTFITPIQCTNCSSATFLSVNFSSANTDSYSVLHCQGTY